MWQIDSMLAHDIIHDRRREAEAAWINRVFDGGRLSMTPSPRPSSPGPVRRAVAGALRHVGNAASAVSEGACTAAARLEGQAA